jgi:hypothetical protein
VTGRNASSTGYWLAFDSIALIPTNRRETESLAVAAKSLPTHSVFTNVNMSNGAGTLFGNNKVGDYVAYAVPVTKAGTYKVRVGIRTLSNRGIFQLSIDGVNQGLAQDEFSAVTSYVARDLGTVTFATTGTKMFKFLVTGRNVSSTGWWLAFDYIELVP